MKSLRDESGQALIVVALGLTSVLGFVGLAVDVGSLMYNKRQLQIAADAAAIAAATIQNAGGYVAAGQNASSLNGFPNGGAVTVTINSTPTAGEYLGQSGYYEAIIQKTEPTIFMALFGHGSVPVSARAVATRTSTNNLGCIYTLGATGTDVTINGSNINVQSPQCGLFDDSNSSQALLVNGSSITLNMAAIGVVGNYLKNGSGINLTPANPSIGITPYSDPLAFLPDYTCTSSSCGNGINTVSCKTSSTLYNGSNQTISLTPGCYDGLTVNGNNQTVNMSAGTYIFNGNGGLLFNGNNTTVNGTGVTIYMASGGVTVNGSTTLNLSAPTTGTYSGMLFDQNPSDGSAALINGSSNASIKGILYFPSAQLTMNGNNTATMYTDLIVNSLLLNGTINFNDYASLSGVNSPLTSVTLVE